MNTESIPPDYVKREPIPLNRLCMRTTIDEPTSAYILGIYTKGLILFQDDSLGAVRIVHDALQALDARLCLYTREQWVMGA